MKKREVKDKLQKVITAYNKYVTVLEKIEKELNGSIGAVMEDYIECWIKNKTYVYDKNKFKIKKGLK